MNNWINAKVLLPTENQSVLVCNAEGLDTDEREPIIAFIKNRTWTTCFPFDFNTWREVKVTHWMPLPDPYGDTK